MKKQDYRNHIISPRTQGYREVMYSAKVNTISRATLGRGTVWGKISRIWTVSRQRAERRQTHKHRGFGGFAQSQVFESVLLVLAPLRELFHPDLARLRRGSQRWGQAARKAHGPAPLRGLPGAAGIDTVPRGGRALDSSGLHWANRALRNRPLQNVPEARG